MKFIPKAGLPLEHLQESSRLMSYVIQASLEGQLKCINTMLMGVPVNDIQNSKWYEEFEAHVKTFETYREAHMKGLALDADSIADLHVYEEAMKALGVYQHPLR